MREITLAEFMENYEKGLITEIVYIGEAIRRVYGKSVKDMADKPKGYELVWAKVP